jgi:hypothetical protein
MNFSKFRVISDFVNRSSPSPRCPGKKAGAEAEKGREKPSRFSPLGFRKEKRRQRDNGAETAEARFGKRGTAAFFGEANAFWPGYGTIGP